MKITHEQLEERLARNPALALRNPHLCPPSCPQSEPAVCLESVGTTPREDCHAKSCAVSIVSYRHRLLDTDNLCAKYFLDAIRYSQLIADDCADEIEYSIRQEKVERPEDERTEIILTPL